MSNAEDGLGEPLGAGLSQEVSDTTAPKKDVVTAKDGATATDPKHHVADGVIVHMPGFDPKHPPHPKTGSHKPRLPPPGANDCLTVSAMKELRERALGADQVEGDVAEELSAALSLAERIRARNIYIENAAEKLNFIFECLLHKTPRLLLARDQRLRMQMEVYNKSGKTSRLLAWISSGSPVGLVLTALIASIVIWATMFWGMYTLATSDLFTVSPPEKADPWLRQVLFMDLRLIAIITSAAFLGGVISIGTRLKEFSRVRDLDPFSVFWTAMLKPLIGVILALIILAALLGDIIGFAGMSLTSETLSLGAESIEMKALYMLWVIGFVAGFSERFAWDFVDRAQGAFGVGTPVPPTGTVGRGGLATK